MKIIIFGIDSFITQNFVERYSHEIDIKCFTRFIIFVTDILKIDYFDIQLEELLKYDVLINFAAIVHQPKATHDLYYT